MQTLCTLIKIQVTQKHNKQIPNIINDRLKKRSSTEKKFIKVKNDYELIMEICGLKNNLSIKTLN